MVDSNSGITFVLDTSNQHPKVKPEDQLEEFLVRFELIITDNSGNKSSTSGGTNVNTFNVYGLTWAKDSKDAFFHMNHLEIGTNYRLERREVIGAVKDEDRRRIHDKLHDIGGGIILP